MTKRKPNVIVFFTDQQRWDSTGLHGNPLDLTPNYDRMASEGTHCATTVTCQPVCGPARASLQTGKYATNTGVWRNGIAMRKDETTLAHWFREAGYTTAYIGKWHLGNEHETEAVPEEERGGYEYWLGANILEFCSEAYDMVLYDNDNQPQELPGYRVDGQLDAMIRYIKDHKDEPFFMFSSFIEPHHQNRLDDYIAPDGYRERYQNKWIPPDLAALGGTTQQHIAGYWGIIKRIDEALGRLRDALKSMGLEDNTIIAYTSDHGSHFKTRNGEYKRACHEACTRVPTAFTGPGFVGGGNVKELVSLVDLPPTLLDAADIPVPESMQGYSIMPLLRGEKDGWQEEVYMQISEAQVGRAVRTQRWKYAVRAMDMHDGPGSDHYTEEFLYDLESDPYELCNLINEESHDKVKHVMRERLLGRMKEAGEDEPTIELAPTHASGQRWLTDTEVYS